jgi:hypothetical protein
MPQQAIAAILLRQLTSYLARAIFWVDLAGNLLFYDEPAGALLGYRYEGGWRDAASPVTGKNGGIMTIPPADPPRSASASA